MIRWDRGRRFPEASDSEDPYGTYGDDLWDGGGEDEDEEPDGDELEAAGQCFKL